MKGDLADKMGLMLLPKEKGFSVAIDRTSGFHLRQEIAKGKTESGEEFEVFSVIPDGSIMVSFGKDHYLVSMKKVVEAVIEHREQSAGETPAPPEEGKP